MATLLNKNTTNLNYSLNLKAVIGNNTNLNYSPNMKFPNIAPERTHILPQYVIDLLAELEYCEANQGGGTVSTYPTVGQLFPRGSN